MGDFTMDIKNFNDHLKKYGSDKEYRANVDRCIEDSRIINQEHRCPYHNVDLVERDRGEATIGSAPVGPGAGKKYDANVIYLACPEEGCDVDHFHFEEK